MAEHNDLGKKGEELAVAYLREKGYRILERNYYFQKAEVDILALRDEMLVVVEVKLRSTNYFGTPQEFVNAKKIQLLVTAANHYIEVKNLDVEVRFDIIAIVQQYNQKTSIEHIEDAFLHF